jgi:hypothetical protein
MNDILEFWSLPWHTLQRSMANSFDAEAGTRSTSASHGATTPGANSTWLARARNDLRQPCWAKR